MKIGIGLPAAVPGTPPVAIGKWAAAAEACGFESVGVIDRLVYDNLDPIVALAVAASTTKRVELLTTVLNVAWRRNGLVLAKQLASLDAVSGDRLTAGLGMGGWPDDHEAVGPAHASLGTIMDEMVATMRRAWSGDVGSGSATIPAAAPGRPRLLFGGLAPASFRRAARCGEGWVAPSFGYETLTAGIDSIRHEWQRAGRSGQPRVVVERYFCLGDHAADTSRHYLDHYYGPVFSDAAIADTVTTVDGLHHELGRLDGAGCDDVVLLPCDPAIEQLERLADALDTSLGRHPRSARVA